MTKPHPKLDPLMEGYLEYMTTVERRAAGTVKDIRCTLRRVSTAMAERHPDKPLWERKLTDFIGWLERQRRQGYSALGLCKNVSHLRGFLNYAWRSGRVDRNVMADFYPEYRCASKEPESLSVEEALRMAGRCPSTTPLERRDRVMILLLYGCGLRTGRTLFACNSRRQRGASRVAREESEGRHRANRSDPRRGVYGAAGVFTGA